MSAYGRALLTLCAVQMKREDELPILVDNLANGVTMGNASSSASSTGVSGGAREETAHWGTMGVCWRWSESAVEATAFTLRALLAADPQNELVVPTMLWLVPNRRGAQWKSTRDTAISILALCDYLRISGETASPVAFRVSMDGKVLGEHRLEGEDLLMGAVHLPLNNPEAGEHDFLIERIEGDGPLYWGISARVFSAEEPIQARASEVFVRRDVYKLVGRDTLLKGKVFDRVPMQSGDSVVSGERLEVVLTIDCPNDLEYLMIRDNKPAGLEATVPAIGRRLAGRRSCARTRWPNALVRSRESRARAGRLVMRFCGDNIGMTGQSRWLYHELRDEAQVFFADSLPSGTWQIRSTLRAEVPGTYHGLPAIAQAMYVPEIRGNSAEFMVTVD